LGLQFDPRTEHYLIDNATDERLLRSQPVLSFQLGSTFDTQHNIIITLPYSSLSLQLGIPHFQTKNDTRYFPIRRAESPTQFVLGRAFLQNAYLIVDYDRRSFSVHQAKFSDSAPVIRQIVPGNGDTLGSWEAEFPQESTPVSMRAIVGVICLMALILLLFNIAFYYWPRSKRTQATEDDSAKVLELESKLPSSIQEADPSACRVEMHNDSRPAEMPDPNGGFSGFFSHAEMDPDAERVIHELEDSSVPVRYIAATDQK
jgi:hypothetical protein